METTAQAKNKRPRSFISRTPKTTTTTAPPSTRESQTATTPSPLPESESSRRLMEIKEKEETVQQQYLTFFLADEEYAVNIQRVKEIIEYTTVTKVPKVPRWIRGVINLRGNVVPVIDLTVRFGLEERPVTKTTCIVIVEVEQDSERAVIGVIADAVNQVIDFGPKDIEEPPAFGTRVRLEYLFGMGKLGKKFALILNVDTVLSTAELLTVSALQAATVETHSNDADNNSGEQLEA